MDILNANKKNGYVIWFTGLSGAGKTTLAKAVQKELLKINRSVELLDGDIVRQSLSRDLGFTKEDRDTNIERVVFVAKLLARNNVIVLVSFISPYRKHRALARNEIENFIEIYVNCPLEECERRDIKGMYKKAKAGRIKNFTGINDPYEVPKSPDIEISTVKNSIKECVDCIMGYLADKGIAS